MSYLQDYRASLKRSREAAARYATASEFSLDGRRWDLLPGVFAPSSSPTTGFSLQLLGLAGPRRTRFPGSLLEIGCGTGVIAVSAALAGSDRVVATDINPAAVANTRLNAERHGVADRCTVVHSDLFDALDPQLRFDTVFWHSNYVLAPETYRWETMHQRAYVDPGYVTHRRFLESAWRWARPGGSVLLHVSARGRLDRLREIATEYGQTLHPLRTEAFDERGLPVEHLLLEVAHRP
ncbi:50S ribosomal protein L11 methyltransferase [Micromonospora sp. SCSIO 07396]